MKYYLIAGEASGDLHGSYLIESIIATDPNADIRFWGGNKMEKSSQKEAVKHIRDLAFMGFVEVITHLNTILSNIRFCKEDIREFQPDIVVFIDYPGFNLRIAKWCKKNQFKTAYYISPQIWAWKESRVHTIRKCIDKMIVILPFEKDFYKKHSIEVDYVGHPLADIIAEEKEKPLQKIGGEKPIIALLPGSRKQEIRKMLPKMISVSEDFSMYDFHIAKAPTISEEFYRELIPSTTKNIYFSPVSTYQLLRQSEVALVTSGTATLEAALLHVPEIVCYMGHPLSVWLARKLIKIRYISLVNLILDKLAVKELIQGELNRENLKNELSILLDKKSIKYADVMKDYQELTARLSQNGAAQEAAKIICTFAKT